MILTYLAVARVRRVATRWAAAGEAVLQQRQQRPQQRPPSGEQARRRTVITQKYTWHRASPRFQPLAEREHGAWVER